MYDVMEARRKMKCKLLVLAASLVVMAFGVAQGQGIYLDHTDGLYEDGEPNTFLDGATLTFYMRVVGDETPHLMLNNGFEFKSENLTWGSCVTGEFNTAEYPVATWFDFVRVMNPFSCDGSGADTLGVGLLSLFGSGLPVDFDGILFTFTIGPITGPIDGVLEFDSSWYGPSNPWMWDIVGVDVAWDGPHFFTLVEQTDVAFNDGAALPTAFALKQNYPNPFNPNTEIAFDVPRLSDVNISIYNILGHRVRTLVDKELPAGRYVASWDGTNESGGSVSSGVYFAVMNTEQYTAKKKMMLIK